MDSLIITLANSVLTTSGAVGASLIFVIVVLIACVKYLISRLTAAEKINAEKCAACNACRREMSEQITSAQTRVGEMQHALTDHTGDFAQTLIRIANTFSELLAKIQK